MSKIDMRGAIIPKSDQLNSDDLMGGRTMTIKVTGVSIVNSDQPAAISFEGDNGKPWKPCKSMCRVLVNIWGDDGRAYVGKHLTLYCDPAVKWGGVAVGGIRISHMEGLTEKRVMPLTSTNGNKKPYIVEPLIIEQAPVLPAFTRDEYVILEEALNDAQTMEELQAAFGNVNAARARMGDEDLAALTAIKDSVKNNLTTPTE